MRTPCAIAACALVGAAVALVLAGCDGRTRPAEPSPDGLLLKPMPPQGDDRQARLYQVRIVRLWHRLRPDAPAEDVWRLLGTTSVPHEKRALWQANDLRLGEGGQMAAERLNELLAETADRTCQVSQLAVRENFDFVVTLGALRPALDIVWADAGGRLGGCHFDEASARFRMVCRRSQTDPGVVCIAMAPEIAHGKQRMRYVRTEHGYTQRMMPDIVQVPDLEAEVSLPPGRILLIGGRRSSDVSVGGAFLFEQRGPDTWQETLIVTAQPVTGPPAPTGGRPPTTE
ncbi:MAG: hypothetical protein ISS74_09175 [Planctomycetes bacterium]|nr:hypothetical protein [Planctomycetota bacterium]